MIEDLIRRQEIKDAVADLVSFSDASGEYSGYDVGDISDVINSASAIVDLSDDDFGAVLNCAIRYCLGRRTYMPGLVTSYIRPLLPHLNDKTLDVMERDIAEQGKFGYGHECDYETWTNFLRDIQAVRSSRET